MSRKKDINSAKTIALRYLSRAPRSICEVESRLKEKGIKDDSIKETLQYLTELGYMSDETFANQWAGSKIKSRLWGKNRIIHGLKQKGISEEIIKLTIDNLGTNELDTAKLALLKWLKNKGQAPESGGQEKLRQKAGAYRHLHTKGFPADVIYDVLKERYNGTED
ncbi:MAG TPA: regulatory protein RecX [Thermodesulfobacteriota bacterium]|nr:regulatory protein RecX [Thermodesulfobacteriota bacterium]